MGSDGKLELMHIYRRRYREAGVSSTTSMGAAIERVERVYGRSYDWQASWPPSPRDLEIIAMVDAERKAA